MRVKNLTASVPIPLAGLMLATVATANLLKPYFAFAYPLFGGISTLLFIILALKLIFNGKKVKEELHQPVIASVSGTFLMGTCFLAVYYQVLFGVFSIILWYLAMLLFFVLMVYFVKTFVLHLDIKQVFASYFIVFVGPVALTNTAAELHQFLAGQIVFWIGLFLLVPTLLLLLYRYIKYPQIQAGQVPIFAVFAAPFSLCLVGYLKAFSKPNSVLIVVLLVFSLVFYFIGLIKVNSIFKTDFYPSFSSYTFPFVNSAIALKLTLVHFHWTGILQLVNEFQIVLAVLLVLVVLWRYLLYFGQQSIKSKIV